MKISIWFALQLKEIPVDQIECCIPLRSNKDVTVKHLSFAWPYFCEVAILDTVNHVYNDHAYEMHVYNSLEISDWDFLASHDECPGS